MPRGNRPSASAEPQGQLAGQVMHISLELSQATWLVTALIPGVDKMSKHTTTGGDGVALIELLDRLRAKIDPRSPRSVRVIAIEEAGLDGFWVHRLLEVNGVESHVVDAASIAVPGAVVAQKRTRSTARLCFEHCWRGEGDEPRVCAMVVPPCARTAHCRARLLGR